MAKKLTADQISDIIWKWSNGQPIEIMHLATGFLSVYYANVGINFRDVSINDYYNIRHNVLFWYPLRDNIQALPVEEAIGD